MAAESLLIRARTAFSGLAQALSDSARSSEQVLENTEQSASAAQQAARAAAQKRQYEQAALRAGPPKRAIDWDREESAMLRAGRNPDAEYRQQRAWYEERVRQDQLRQDRVEAAKAAATDQGVGAAGAAGGGEGTSIIAAGKKMLLRFGGPYALWQGFSGGLPGQSGARAADFATDKLLRSTDGFVDNFDTLKEELKKLADAADIANDKFGELALATARTAGNITGYESLKIAQEGVEASRSLGLSDEVMPQWLSEMRWNEAGNTRELLPMIGAAVAKAQMPGRSEELLRGILGYTEKMQNSLARSADVAGYVNTVASMSEFAAENKYPGMKGQGAMGLLDSIDAAVSGEGNEAQEIFWYKFFEDQGITDPAEQRIFRANGLSARPDLLRKVPAAMEKFNNTTEAMGKNYTTLSLGNLFKIPIGQSLFFQDWAKKGGRGKVSDITDWLGARGFSDRPIKANAVPDVGKLFDVATGEKAKRGDWMDLQGLGARYLSDAERAVLGKEPNEKWVDAILKKLMVEGREKTAADTGRQTLDTAGRVLTKAGETLNAGADTLGDVAEVLSVTVREWGASLGLMDPVEEEARLRGEAAAGRLAGGFGNLTSGVGNYFAEKAKWGMEAAGMTFTGKVSAERERRAAEGPVSSGGYTIDPNAIPSGRAGNRARPYLEMVAESARRHGVPPHILAGMLMQESGFNPSRTGDAGEIGIAQIKPGTARLMGLDPEAMKDARQGIDAGARYLRYNYDAYGGDSWTEAVSGYNAGHNRSAIKRGEIPNEDYVNSVLGVSRDYRDVFKEAPAPAPTTPVTEPTPTAVPADSGASEPSAGLWGWPRGAPGTGAGWGFPGPLMPMFASIEVVQRTDTGEIAQRDTRRLAAASYPMPPHLGPSPYAEARV